jgi:hypothetical protein
MPSAARILAHLDACKGMFGNETARSIVALLKQVRRARFGTAAELIHLHETLLFLRAYPQSAEVVRLCDAILFGYAQRLRRRPPEVLAEFEYSEISGIAGTGLTTNFSYAFTKSLAERHAAAPKRTRNREGLSIAWDHFAHVERLAAVLADLIPEAREAWAVGRHADWRKRLEAYTRGNRGGAIQWLLERVRPEVYDLLEIPVRWELGSSDASRSRARIPRRGTFGHTAPPFYHNGPLLARRDVSISAEFAAPPIGVTKLSKARAHKILGVIVDASAVRYRELYGFEYPDEARVYHADLGRGMDFYFFGVPRRWRLPSREYCAGMYFKNGVPIGYVEVMWTGGMMEVGFNLYYTFRQGETAWLYARLLKLFHQQFGVEAFTIDPYQLGHENEEAIASGAFWFYAKLGFHSQSKRVRDLVEREERRMKADPGYRTPARNLRKLAEAPMLYRFIKAK